MGSSLFLKVAPDRLPTREPSAEVALMLNSVEPPAVSSELAAFWACEEFAPMLDGIESSVGSNSNHQENSEDCKYMAKP